MDLNDLRSAVTLFSLLMFLGIAAWAWWPRNRKAFDDAAQLPFLDETKREARS
jgi:cytochrome c oxidase cbb3-type subunit 4